MREFINRLRTKSESTKQKIAFGAALGITLIILGGWFLGKKSARTDELVQEQSASEDLKPLFLIFQNAKEGFRNVKANVKEYRDNAKAPSQTSAEASAEETSEEFTIIE